QLNASHTDRIVSNSFSKAVDYLGLTEGADGLVVQGATEAAMVPDPEDPENTIQGYILDLDAYDPNGVIMQLIDLQNTLPEGLSLDNTGISQAIYTVADNINDRREQDEKRWGLRPYRFNVFTSYDFKEGILKGWTIGGGYRWTAANIIGEENVVEYEGEPISEADFLLRYRTARSKGGLLGDGRWTFQLNIQNLFDND
ncbi:MAG: TonB-dependent receptor, partial [Verrucomicrobiae bacterium]|nr:TonB-dependent receptor [Verrucomicrobiae bacterium]